MAKKAKQKAARTRTAEQKEARRLADQNRRNAGAAGTSAPEGEKANIPPSAKQTKTESEHAAEESANAAAEVSRRRHEPGAPDPEDDGPDLGRVDNRPDTSFEAQQMPRPARPLTPVNAHADRIAPVATPEDEDPMRVDKGFPKKVKAIEMGYYRHSRRRAGDVFMIYNAQEFSPKWMEYAGSSDPEKITTGQQELERQRRETLEDRLAKKKAGTGDTNVLGAA